jgi:putative phage-type endonuclease
MLGERKQENLEQNTEQWHEFRATHYGASEAASMLGLLPYESRSELLKRKATGIKKEVNGFTKSLFEKGHEVEELARPLTEGIIGDQLYPVTYSMGKLSASCDGLTSDGTIAFENKLWNDFDATEVSRGFLPEKHWSQCQQILLVTGAEKLIFVISDGTPDMFEWLYVYPDKVLQQRIIDGWGQFDKDVKAYNHVEVIEPQKFDPITGLPAIYVQVKGELTACNLDVVRPYFDKFLAEAITDLVTDEDFALAEVEAKLGRETAKRCLATAKSVIEQTASISEVTRELEAYATKFNTLALAQEKAVKTQKEQRKEKAKADRKKAFEAHVGALNDKIRKLSKHVTLSVPYPDFDGAMKNQRLLSSLYDKLDTELANGKIRADVIAKDMREKLVWFNTYVFMRGEYFFLFNDLQNIITNNGIEEFQGIVKSRIDDYAKQQEFKAKKERERISEEERSKLVAKELKPIFKEAIQANEYKKALKEDCIPTRQQLISCIADDFGTDDETAEQWLINAFGETK